jgi:predicted HicB family RNase H-like nuclease
MGSSARSTHRLGRAPGREDRVAGEAWVQLTTRISKLLHHRAKERSAKMGLSLMDFVVEALKEHLEQQQGPAHSLSNAR